MTTFGQAQRSLKHFVSPTTFSIADNIDHDQRGTIICGHG